MQTGWGMLDDSTCLVAGFMTTVMVAAMMVT